MREREREREIKKKEREREEREREKKKKRERKKEKEEKGGVQKEFLLREGGGPTTISPYPTLCPMADTGGGTKTNSLDQASLTFFRLSLPHPRNTLLPATIWNRNKSLFSEDFSLLVAFLLATFSCLFREFFRGFFVALFCLEKRCSGLFRYFFVVFSWPPFWANFTRTHPGTVFWYL